VRPHGGVCDHSHGIARFNIDVTSSLTAVQILYEFLDSNPTEIEESNKPPLIVIAGKVQFSSVNFSYRTGEPVLQKMSFVADPGQVTALVGHSGGGKTTIFNLLLRFYETQGGTITIDGTDIFTISRGSLRQQIAYVGQDIFLFKGTIRENIALGRIDADEQMNMEAAKAAFAHEFIMTFPLGYDTQVGEHGVQLSLGQRQRIAVARALIKDAPIILLDEPTASLDSESERKVHEAISRLCQGRTTLVIAHRLYTIVNADRIYVIEQGSVAESGRHSKLLLLGGRYAGFFRAQVKQDHLETASHANKAPLDDQMVT
jgi:ATP-binding cassette, subfamily B, bacterial MsbA